MLIGIINKDTDELTNREVEAAFKRLLHHGLMEQTPLDMRELTEDALMTTDLSELSIINSTNFLEWDEDRSNGE